ncbi:MAG: FG-GAP repeat protein [Deltaproteobacteria bacterium]|nr:FG-GAP repeat protein [Deltaproteobacteria bacterium]
MRTPITLSTLAALALGGCTFGKFDDYEAKAPAVKISQVGNIKSNTFGGNMLGIPSAGGSEGGILLAAGSAPVALDTVGFNPSGKYNQSQTEAKDLKEDLGEPERFNGIAAAPSDKAIGAFPGPFAYVATTSGLVGKVYLIDVNRYAGPNAYGTPSNDLKNFGASVTPANLGGSSVPDDLVVGAQGKVVLWRADIWPNLEADAKALVVEGSGRWPANGNFDLVAAGQFDAGTPEDEVVVSVPANNYVAIIHKVAECLAAVPQPCKSILELPIPDRANGFGKSLLVGDVDADGKLDLVVGAPETDGRGAIYVYKLNGDHFKDGATPPAPQVIGAPQGAVGFGGALAFGKFEGGDQRVLAVSAPSSDVEGTLKAGRVYLYRLYQAGNDKPVSEAGVTLVRPPERGLLGLRLATLPFRVGAVSHEVLVAASSEAIYAFFASTTDKHKDVRAR